MIHDATTLEIIQACTNTGRWGSSDELGTLNHITDAVRLAAIRAVSYGAAVSIGLDLPTRSGGSGSAVHVMGTAVGSTSVVDTLTVSPHGFEITHLDALAHNFLDERAYNGRAQSEVLSPMGLSFGSVMSARDGIVTRGSCSTSRQHVASNTSDGLKASGSMTSRRLSP